MGETCYAGTGSVGHYSQSVSAVAAEVGCARAVSLLLLVPLTQSRSIVKGGAVSWKPFISGYFALQIS